MATGGVGGGKLRELTARERRYRTISKPDRRCVPTLRTAAFFFSASSLPSSLRAAAWLLVLFCSCIVLCSQARPLDLAASHLASRTAIRRSQCAGAVGVSLREAPSPPRCDSTNERRPSREGRNTRGHRRRTHGNDTRSGTRQPTQADPPPLCSLGSSLRLLCKRLMKSRERRAIELI